jgi:ribosomal protein S16
MQSYLELISLYKDLLARKREELRLDKERLENGVTKIAQASAQVSHQNVCWCQCLNMRSPRSCSSCIFFWIRTLKHHAALS